MITVVSSSLLLLLLLVVVAVVVVVLLLMMLLLAVLVATVGNFYPRVPPFFSCWNYCIFCLLCRVVTEREVDDGGSVSFFWWYEFECVEMGGADAGGGGAAAAAAVAVANCQEREGERRDVSNWGLGAIAGEE